MKEILKEALIITVFMISVFAIVVALFFFVGLVAETGSVILTILSGVIGMFVFVSLLLVGLCFIEHF